MLSSEILTVSRNDACSNCHATARFHLQNPFGIYFKDTPSGRYYWEWHTKASNSEVCEEYHVNSSYTLNHDMLYNHLSRV